MGSDNSPNNDLLNGDPSLLLLYAVDSDQILEEDKTRLLSIYSGETSDLDIDFVQRVYENTGALQKAIEKMEEFATLAGAILENYPKSDARESLFELLDQYNHNFTSNLETLSYEFIKA